MADRVMLLVGTEKGGFIVEGGRAGPWAVRGPMCDGWSIHDMNWDPASRAIYADIYERIAGVCAHHFHWRIDRQTFAHDALPGFAAVASAHNHRAIVAGAVTVECDVGDISILRIGFDPRDPRTARTLGEIVRNSAQVAPSSCVTQSRPSSVPAQSCPGFTGDSASE